MVTIVRIIPIAGIVYADVKHPFILMTVLTFYAIVPLVHIAFRKL